MLNNVGEHKNKSFVYASQLLLQTDAELMELTDTTLQEVVYDQCPCFEQMYVIFGAEQNITGFNSFDSSLERKKENSNSNSSNSNSFSNSAKSSSEEGRSVNALVTINTGADQLNL
ncbi:hypothetical protein O181_114759 [Austropuccinia psidii MF-1]|uniref:Uncharacterized protein n=1 Tax=Austropuccinia psidii MF-1 TaxID=1389203 RepID=A0A9Q3PUY1_9BASI|nr:hypothetical protein [Austropuccinia psidii MF-1]